MQKTKVINPDKFGVSFSVKQCHKFGQDPRKTLKWLIGQGFRRFRLMSYWDEHEKSPGKYNYQELDWQIKMIAKSGGIVTLCLGARQPRWPEFHWPDWAWQVSFEDRTDALLLYVAETVKHFKQNDTIVSYQLENEALLKGFGDRIEINRQRLFDEFNLIRELDPSRPIIMSTSAAWGIPFIGPIPDIIASSYYLIRWKDTRYTTTYHAAFIHRIRAFLVKILWGKPFFIHELQLEPWGPKDIWEMTHQEQDGSMGPKQIIKNLSAGKRTKLYPIDLWGGEWWYQRTVIDGDPETAQLVKQLCLDS